MTTMNNNLIKHSEINFHNGQELPIQLFDDTNTIFGTVNIQMRDEIPIIKTTTRIFFNIDCSGSMSDNCSDNRTKMSHILHTLENMLRELYLKEEANISVHIQAFDSHIYEYITDETLIKDGNIEELINKTKKIHPRCSTNIGKALESINTKIIKYMETNPSHDVVHILLTDGEITDGINNKKDLKQLVNDKYPNIFIGYGVDHDSALLSYISDNRKGEYRFIDALEKAGLVYGEILNDILYKGVEDVELIVTNGEIYDYQTNAWSNKIYIGNLVNEQNKTYHLRSLTPTDCQASIYGKNVVLKDDNITLQEHIKYYGLNDLTNYIYRQRTQELLYESRNVDNFDEDSGTYNKNNNIIRETKCKLKTFLKQLTEYIDTNNLKTDAFLKNLCDDIYIAYRTLGTNVGNMYACARQISQGRQQTYVTNELDEDIFSTQPTHNVFTKLTRQVNFQCDDYNNVGQINFQRDDDYNEGQDNQDLDNNFNDYILSQTISPYKTNSAVSMMRNISGNHSIGTDTSEIYI